MFFFLFFFCNRNKALSCISETVASSVLLVVFHHFISSFKKIILSLTNANCAVFWLSLPTSKFLYSDTVVIFLKYTLIDKVLNAKF